MASSFWKSLRGTNSNVAVTGTLGANPQRDLLHIHCIHVPILRHMPNIAFEKAAFGSCIVAARQNHHHLRPRPGFLLMNVAVKDRLEARKYRLVCLQTVSPSLPAVYGQEPAFLPRRRGCPAACRVPEECPAEISDIISACLEQDSGLRPTAKQIITRLQQQGAAAL